MTRRFNKPYSASSVIKLMVKHRLKSISISYEGGGITTEEANKEVYGKSNFNCDLLPVMLTKQEEETIEWHVELEVLDQYYPLWDSGVGKTSTYGTVKINLLGHGKNRKLGYHVSHNEVQSVNTQRHI